MKYVYTLRFMRNGSQGMLKYSFVSSATFEQALSSALKKVHRQYPSEAIQISSFLAEPGEDVPDQVGEIDNYER